MINKAFTVTVFAIFLILSGTNCKPTSKPNQNAIPISSTTNVLLITLDTTRADRIGCYGYDQADTPTLDRLARDGILFERAYAQVPLTLPSHATIMTGRYPREHGILINGRNSLNPDNTTLATAFKQHGYNTGAIIGAWVLNSSFGLNQGFDHYQESFGTLQKSSSNEVQRRADSVTDEALLWLSKTKDKPFFAWIHYYDPHDPYEPPEKYRREHPDPYDGEIAFVDSQIKRVLELLESNDILDRTMIVVVGDHGESFGEHGEKGHSFFLYQTNLHVPMIVSHPSFRGPRRIHNVVSIADLYPTLLSLMKWDAPVNRLSRSLAVAVTGEEVPATAQYAENQHPFLSFGWAQQRSLITNRWKYISSTIPELYDLENDPDEKRNVIKEFPQLASQMRDSLSKMYDEMKPGLATSITLSNEARRKLESLGYVSGGSQTTSSEFLTPGLSDPKDRLDVYNAVHEGRKLLEKGETKNAISIFQTAVQSSPESMSVQFILGFAYQEDGQHNQAIKTLQQAATLDPTYPAPLNMIAKSYESLGQFPDAQKHYRASLAINTEDATTRVALAHVLQNMGRQIEAIEMFEQVLQSEPGNLKALESLTSLYLNAKEVKKAVEILRSALPHAPNSLIVLKPLASLLATAPYDELRDGELAVELAERSVKLTKRNDPIVLATLAAAYAQIGHFDNAITIATQAAELAKSKQMIPLSNFIINYHIASYRAAQPFIDKSLLK